MEDAEQRIDVPLRIAHADFEDSTDVVEDDEPPAVLGRDLREPAAAQERPQDGAGGLVHVADIVRLLPRPCVTGNLLQRVDVERPGAAGVAPDQTAGFELAQCGERLALGHTGASRDVVRRAGTENGRGHHPKPDVVGQQGEGRQCIRLHDTSVPNGMDHTAAMDVIPDLAAEQDRLESLLSDLTDEQWSSPSAAAGWSIADVVLHLAQTEEAVSASIANAGRYDVFDRGDKALDAAVDDAVAAQRAPGAVVFERWRAARRAALDSLRSADPDVRVPWAATPLKPKVLATTRLAEHWAHGLDITAPLGLPFPDTDRLRHIAWLGHRTLPYAFAVDGVEPHDLYCELTAPDGSSTWTFGPADAESSVRGPAGDFCRIGARRLRPEDSSLVTAGPHAAEALRVLRNYAA